MLVLMLVGCTLLDRQPPVLSATWAGAPTPVSKVARLQVVASDASGVRAWVEGPDGSHIDVVDGWVDVPVASWGQGPVAVEVWAEDESVWSLQTHTTVHLVVDSVAPQLSIPAVTEGVGRTAALWVDSDETLIEPRVTVFGVERPLYPVDGRYRAMVGIGLRETVGDAVVEVHASDLAGNEVHQEGVLSVTEVSYPVKGSIRLTKAQVAARKDDEAKERTQQTRQAAYALERPTALWSGPFVSPLDPHRKTSPFGSYRRYSDGTRSYHTGMDVTWSEGSVVVAAAHGEVVVAELQAIHGNAVILHHGQGVVSAYSHLERIDVGVGDLVGAGEAVGVMGSTGQSTGPHVHFTVVVGGKAVDPAQWLEEGF